MQEQRVDLCFRQCLRLFAEGHDATHDDFAFTLRSIICSAQPIFSAKNIHLNLKWLCYQMIQYEFHHVWQTRVRGSTKEQNYKL